MAPAGYGSRVEGLHAVTAAAAAGRVEHLYVEERRRGRADVSRLIHDLGRDRVSVVRDLSSEAESSAPQGLVAACRPILPVSLESMAGAQAALIVLDHVEDPHNVGAVARSAVAAGMSGLIVSSRRSAPLSAVAFKSAAGALESLPVAVVSSIPEALRRLKSLDVWIVGLDARADTSLFGLEILTEGVAAVIGAEGTGLSELTRKRCDVVASIPMATGSDSLNASVSAALASFEIMRVRNAQMPG